MDGDFHADPPQVVDLFCGAGGLSLGFRMAGLNVVAAHDSWRPAVESYAANHGSHVYETMIDENIQLPHCDLIAGGPPCQGFSSAGLRRARDDRNTLVGVFARVIARKRPPAFLFENVEGFLTGEGGCHVFELLDPLIEAGYRIHVRKINAANFGIPQHRKRVIAIGGLGWDPIFPLATHVAFGAPGANRAAKGSLPRTRTFRDALVELTSARKAGHRLSDDDIQLLEGQDLERAKAIGQGQSMKDMPEHLWHPSYRRRANRRVADGMPTEKRGGAPHGMRRLRLDEPSKAITGGAMRDLLHPIEDRPLTIRECATLQTFPLEYRFIGSRSDKMQLIGNAVPPALAKILGSSIASSLSIAQKAGIARQPGALLSFVPTASDGMSPALLAVLKRVEGTYKIETSKVQGELRWA